MIDSKMCFILFILQQINRVYNVLTLTSINKDILLICRTLNLCVWHSQVRCCNE